MLNERSGWRRWSVLGATLVALMLVVLPIAVISLQSRATEHRNRAIEVGEPLATATRMLESAVLRLASASSLRASGAPVDDETYLNRRAEVVQAAEALTAASDETPFETSASAVEAQAERLVELFDLAEQGELEDPNLWTPFGDGPLPDYLALSNALQTSVDDFRAGELSDADQFDRYSAASLISASVIAAIAVVVLTRTIAIRIRAERELWAREQKQSALAEYGRRALVSRLDIGALRREAINRIAETLGVENVVLMELLPDGQSLVLREGLGWDEEAIGALEISADRTSHAGYVLLQDRPVSFADLDQDERFESEELAGRGIKSGIGTLVRLHDRTWGVIAAYSTSKRQFSEDDALFIRAVANVLATSILEREAQVRQRILIETSAVLAQSLDDPASLANVAHVAVPDIADDCLILLLADDRRLRVAEVASAAEATLGEQFAALRTQEIGEQSVVWPVIESRESVIHNYLDGVDLIGNGSSSTDVPLAGLTLLSVLVAPISARGRAIGAIAFICETGRFFPSADAPLGTEIGNRIGLAIDNARLFERTRDVAELREEFAHVVAHELRNPLTSVLGYSRMLLRAHGDRDERQLTPDDVESLQTIYQAAERMQAALETFVALARVEDEEPDLETETIDLAGEVDRELAVAADRSEAPIQIQRDFPDGAVTIVTDLDLLKVILRNLIENGIKYSGSPPELLISVRVDGSRALVSVEDNGEGIAAGERDRVFERGYRSEGAPGSGSGLGLYISARLAAALRANLDIGESANLGGARVVLSLPAAAPAHS